MFKIYPINLTKNVNYMILTKYEGPIVSTNIYTVLLNLRHSDDMSLVS
jgi:hypothetical protein